MMTLIWLVVGLILGEGLLRYARSRGGDETRILAIGLVVASAFYVGFAALWAAPGWIGVEVLGVVVYAGFAGLGLRRSPMWLAAGWALHPLWDAGLHLVGPGHAFAPSWYTVACISFDVWVALVIAYRARAVSPTDASMPTPLR